MKIVFVILFYSLHFCSISQNPVNEFEKHLCDPNEKFIGYYKNGNLKISFTRKNGNLEGDYSSYRKNGKRLSIYFFENGRFHGADTTFNKNEQITFEETYTHDTLLFFKETTYHKNKQIKEEIFLNFDTDSLKACPFSKIKQSYGKRFDYDVTLVIDKMKSHGKHIIYHKNGKVKEEVPLIDNLWEGNAKGYYEDGKLYWEGTYHNDFLDGVFTYYSHTGEITKNVTYVKGKKIKTEKK